MVAHLPFKPFSYLQHVVSYNLDRETAQDFENSDNYPVGAPFLFIIAFLSLKVLIRKTWFRKNKVQLKIKGLSEYRVAIPKNMLF